MGKKESVPNRQYTEEFKTEAVRLALSTGGNAAAEFERAASQLRVPLKVIRDTAAGGREAYRAGLILVRPDQFVAWAGDEADATDVLRRAIGMSARAR